METVALIDSHSIIVKSLDESIERLVSSIFDAVNQFIPILASKYKFATVVDKRTWSQQEGIESGCS